MVERLKPSDLQLLTSHDVYRYYSFNAHERNCLFLNLGGRQFIESGYATGVDVDLESRGVAVADFDEDGGLDLAVRSVARRKLSLFHNEIAAATNVLRVQLVGTKSNRDAVGAVVSIRTGNLTQTRVRVAGSGFQGQSEATLHFGLGRAPLVEELTVRWPSGLVERFDTIGPNAVARIVEGEGRLSTRPLRGARRARTMPAADNALAWGGWTLAGESWRPTLGRPTVVALSAAWCPGCANEVETLNELHGRLAPHVQVIGIALDDERTARAWATQHGARYEVIRATHESIYPLIRRYFGDESLPLPATLLLDSSGNVVKLFSGRLPHAAVDRAVARLGLPKTPAAGMPPSIESPRPHATPVRQGGAVER